MVSADFSLDYPFTGQFMPGPMRQRKVASPSHRLHWSVADVSRLDSTGEHVAFYLALGT
jgi:ABC-type transporter Mla MlaB component